MIQLRLPTESHHVDLVANDMAANVSFQVLGPNTEVAFVEELICQKFGSLKVSLVNCSTSCRRCPLTTFGPVALLRGDNINADQRKKIGFKTVHS